MDSRLEDMDLDFDFLVDEEVEVKPTRGLYKVIVADDDEEIHNVTKMILRNFVFEGRGLELIHTYSGEETKRALEANPDTALIFLDVVMETSQSGLEVVEYLRGVLNNQMTRIVLRTGQPGEAPEERIIRDYDINDYRIKTELTVNRMHTTLYSALRNFRDLMRIERHRRGLERIIETSANVFRHNHLNEFLTSILNQMAGFKLDTGEMVFIHKEGGQISGENSGVIALENDHDPIIVAATGKYESYIGKSLNEVEPLSDLSQWVSKAPVEDELIHVMQKGFIIRNASNQGKDNYIYIEGEQDQFDFDLIKTFLSNYAVALENYILNNLINSTQKEIIITLGEAVEHHFDKSGSHIKRVSEMMYRFSLLNNFSYTESEVLKVASTMHDVGKIAISDDILRKRGKLSPEEFKLIQEHPVIGHQILSKSDLEIMRIAAEIALYHHERYDGKGYPLGVKGKDIPLRARMMAVVDVYDAVTHERSYGSAMTHEEAIGYLIAEKGGHFDPRLIELFVENQREILEGIEDE